MNVSKIMSKSNEVEEKLINLIEELEVNQSFRKGTRFYNVS